MSLKLAVAHWYIFFGDDWNGRDAKETTKKSQSFSHEKSYIRVVKSVLQAWGDKLMEIKVDYVWGDN